MAAPIHQNQEQQCLVGWMWPGSQTSQECLGDDLRGSAWSRSTGGILEHCPGGLPRKICLVPQKTSSMVTAICFSSRKDRTSKMLSAEAPSRRSCRMQWPWSIRLSRRAREVFQARSRPSAGRRCQQRWPDSGRGRG